MAPVSLATIVRIAFSGPSAIVSGTGLSTTVTVVWLAVKWTSAFVIFVTV